MSYDREDDDSDIAVPITSLHPPQSEGTEHDELEEEEREDTPPPPPPAARTVSRRRSNHTGRQSQQQQSTSQQQHPHMTLFEKDPDIAVPQFDDINPPHRSSSQSIRNLNGTSSNIHAMTQPMNPRNGHLSNEGEGGLNRTTSHTSTASSSSSQPARFPAFMGDVSLHQQQGQPRPPLAPPIVGSKRSSNLSHELVSSNNVVTTSSTTSHSQNNGNKTTATLSPSGRVRNTVNNIILSASQLLGGQRSNGSIINNQSGSSTQTRNNENGHSHSAHPASPNDHDITAPTSSASPRTNEHIEATLVVKKAQATMNRPTPGGRARISDIANAESQTPDVVDSDDEALDEEQYLNLGATQLITQDPTPTIRSATNEASSQALRSSQLANLAASQGRPSNAMAGGRPASTISGLTQSSQHLPSPERRPTSRTITSPPKTKNGPFQKDASRDDDEETEHSDEEDDHHLDHHVDTNRDTSDPDRTRVNNTSFGDSDTSAQTHNGGAVFRKVTVSQLSKNQKNQHVYSGRKSTEANANNATTNGITNGKKAPMARRTGGAPVGPKVAPKNQLPVSHEIIDDDEEESDDEELPPPLSTRTAKTTNEALASRQLRISTRGAQSPAQQKKSSAPPSTAAKSKVVKEPTSGTRRSGRSSHPGSVIPRIKIGDKMPFKDSDKLLEAARTFIEHGEHVANLTLSTMHLNEKNEFEETQAAIETLVETGRPRVKTWQVFIYCRNRKIAVPKTAKSPKKNGNGTPGAGATVNGSRAGSHASPSRISNNVAPAASGSSNDSAQSNEEAPSLPIPSLNMPPTGTYRHAKDANCPAQISAYLVLDTRNVSKSHWYVDQVTEHCLECVGLDMDIGKGMQDQLEARRNYFVYWAQHWDAQVKEVLSHTRNFKKKPPPDEVPDDMAQRLAQQQANVRHANSSRNGTTNGGMDDSGGVGDDEDESMEGQQAPSPQRRKSKRKAIEILEEDEHYDEYDGGADELRPISPELEEVFSPPKKAKPNSNNKSKGRAVQQVSAAAKSRTVSKATPAKKKSSMRDTNKSRAPRSKGKTVRLPDERDEQVEQEEYDLVPETPITDLNLDEEIENLLTECQIHTLEDLREATRGDTNFFESGTDIPLEDFLSFMQNRLNQYAKGNRGFQYDWNRREGENAGPADAALEEEARKSRFVQGGIIVLRASRVLTRALRAVEW